MADYVGGAYKGHRQETPPAATGNCVAGRGVGLPIGTRTHEPAREDGTLCALEETGRAARLLKRALVSVMGREQLSMLAVERLYAALLEAEAATVAVQACLVAGRDLPRQGGPG